MTRIIVKSLMMVAFSAIVFTACKDKEAEKKIAALEARLSEVEGKGGATTPSLNPTQATPDLKPEGPLPVLEFEKVEHDFGTIKEGDKIAYTYKFTNTGDAPLIIESAQPTCGCTVSDYSKDPIPVGGTGFVTANFDSNARTGVQNKTVTVTANTWPKQTVLSFKAMVTPKNDQAPVK